MRTTLPAAESARPSPWLEVRRGRTRAPRRDIQGRRFLIGGGSNCQLQLGGGDVPILHSILLVEEDGAHIDSVVATPQLVVNGRPQRSADLHDGDVFSIGKFEFQVHVPQPSGALQTSPRSDVAIPESMEGVKELSASQLVALIEAEEQQVAELQQSRLNGARALLDALQRAAAASAEAGASGEFLISFPQTPAGAPGVESVQAGDAIDVTARRAS